MADSVTNIQGLVSGIQWRDIVDQLSQIDQTRQLDPITKEIAATTKKSAAWTTYRLNTQNLAAAAAALRDGASLDAYAASASASPTSGRALLSASATSGATAGTHQVEVIQLARAERLSGAAQASSSTALALTGTFAVNGRAVTVAAGDSLTAIRDKINAVNTGTNASGVTASVLATTGGASRLVLSSGAAGARGIELVDSAATGGVLQQLGVTDGSYAATTTTSGVTTSQGFSSTELAIGQMLGLSYPAPASIKIGNRVVAVDLEHDSLSSIVAKIQAAGIGARTVTSTEGGVARSRLEIDAAVSAMPSVGDPAVADADSARTLQLLGTVQAGRSAIAQTVASTALSGAGASIATGSTLLTDLAANGASAGIASGDTMTLTGRRGDGTAVSVSVLVGAGTTMDDVLAQLNGPAGFGGAGRTAVASLGVDGRLRLTDGIAGDSQLAISLSVAKSTANGGGTTGIGAIGVETAGRLRQVVAGSDAQLRVDGTLLVRSTNSVTDAIGGVTLTLQQAEVGSAVELTVSRDTAKAVQAAQTFVTAFNSVANYVKSATGPNGDLAYNGALKASARAFTSTLLSDVVGSTVARTALAGLALDKAGLLAFDKDVFTATLVRDPSGVKSLFALAGSVTGTGLEYVGAGDRAQQGTHAVTVTSLATKASLTGSGAVFPFADGGTVRHLSVTDAVSGTTQSITLANGDTAADVASKLTAMFSANNMRVSASVAGGQLKLDGSQYGSAAAFTLAYDAGDTVSAAQLGLAAGRYAGLDVQGTIGGVAAVGSGQTLTGGAGSTGEGLILRYTGVATGAIGSATINVGVGAQMARIATGITRDGDGIVASNVTALELSAARMRSRGDDVSLRLERRKAALVAQYTEMERALSRIRTQGSSLTAALTALNSSQSSQ